MQVQPELLCKILDENYKPCRYEPPADTDYLRKFFASWANLRDKYDSIWNRMERVVKTRSRRIMHANSPASAAGICASATVSP